MTENLGKPAPDSPMQEDGAFQSFPPNFQPLTVNPFFLTPSISTSHPIPHYQPRQLSPAGCATDQTTAYAGVSNWGAPPCAPSGEVAYFNTEELLQYQHLHLGRGRMRQEIQPAGALWHTSGGHVYPLSPSQSSTQIMEADDSGVEPQASVQRSQPSEQSRVIPLQCLLCPKEPTFSDVSHLLTHISSKSHLACRFKLELLKKSDDDAKAKIIAFEEWYERNEVEALLDTRMAAKKDKSTGIRSKAAAAGGTKRRRSAPSTTTTSTANPQAKIASRNSTLPQPHLHHWNTSSGRASLHLHESRNDVIMDDAYHNPSGDRLQPDSHMTPSSQTSRITRSRAKKISASKEDQADHTDITLPSESTAGPVDTNEIDVAKLKGTVWPGMGIFDAATSEQKRKRNQKKDSSVLQSMITTSRSVLHDKFVWDEDFAGVPRVRDIYASPSIDGSPIVNEASDEVKKVPKKRTRRAKLASENTVRQTRSATKAAAQGRHGASPNLIPKDVKDESDSDVEEMNGDTSDDIFHDSRARRSAVVDGYPGFSLDHDEYGFESPSRPVLHSLNSNATLASPTPVFKQRNHSYPAFGAQEQDRAPTYHTQSSIVPQGHVNQRSFPGSAQFNPLFHPPNVSAHYGMIGYDHQARPMNTFHPINESQQYVPGSWVPLGNCIPPHGNGNAQYDN